MRSDYEQLRPYGKQLAYLVIQMADYNIYGMKNILAYIEGARTDEKYFNYVMYEITSHMDMIQSVEAKAIVIDFINSHKKGIDISL